MRLREYLLIILRIRLLCLSPIVLGLGGCLSHQHLIFIYTELLLLFDDLGVELCLSLNLTFEDTPLLLCFFLQLCQIVLLGLSLGVFVQLGDHLVVVLSFSLVVRLLDEVFVDDSDKLFVALVEGLRGHVGHLRLVQ